MGDHVEMHDAAPGVSKNQERVEDLKSDCPDGEEINRDKLFDVGVQGSSPSLRRWLLLPRHVLADAGVSHLDTELEQFAVNRWSTPHQVFTDPSDQVADICGN